MTDHEAFAYHFKQLEERGLAGPVPSSWDRLGPATWKSCRNDYSESDIGLDDPDDADIDALAFTLVRELTDTTTVAISPPGRNHPRTVTTPAGSVSEDSLLAGLVKTYWKAQGES